MGAITKRHVMNMAYASERSPRSMFFLIPGTPIPLQRPRFSKDGHVWDSQKPQKLIVGLDLISQLDGQPLFTHALEVDFKFYFQLPGRLSADNVELTKNTPHVKRPDIDNAIKFYLDCCSKILFDDDCIVARIHADKLYDDGNKPRTEMIITEIF